MQYYDGLRHSDNGPLLKNELLDLPVEQFLASLRFEQRGKLDKLGIEMGFYE